MKSIGYKSALKLIFLVILLFIITYIFFSFPIMVMPDSTEYYGYLKIFYGEESFSNWNIVRGPTFPVILYIITLFFSNSNTGLLIGTFIFYLMTIAFSVLCIKSINFKNNTTKILNYILFGGTIVLNPILIGYMHGLLTEFAAMPSLIISALLSLMWIKTDRKILRFVLPIIFSGNCVFMWFLKQPYVFLALAPVIISSIISICENRKLRNILYRVFIILLCVISILCANIIWNAILIKNNVNINTGRDTSSFIKNAVVNGNTSFSIDFYDDHYTKEYIINSELINEKDKNDIIKIFNQESKFKSFKLINVFNDFNSREEDNIKEKLVMFSLHDNYSIGDALNTYIRLIVKYPFKTINSYFMNYLALSDVVTSMRHKDANEYYPSLTDGLYFENKSIGCSIYNPGNNMLWLNESHYLYDNVKNLETKNTSPEILQKIANRSFKIYNLIYSISILSLPILFIGLIIRRKRAESTNNKKTLNLGLIVTGSAFIHILFHVFTGAIIDRYGFVVFPAIVIGILIFLFDSKQEERNKMKEKYISNSYKTLTIIPAYNESQNIQKVIDELKTDFPETDILVINDSSKDNTKEIVVSNSVNCITTVFNLNYAYAVQTGIKYAKKYDYDYCLMFDGDGQHIAKEAKKLLDKIKESNCDIVIGSRYLEKGNYNAPKLRKVGTSFFTWLIKASCHTKISDPLSGFQVINKRVIDKYSKMGEYPEFPDANLIIEMLMDGYSIEEVSVKMRNREFGESMHGGIIKPIKYMIVMLYTIVLLILNKVFGRSK